MSITQLKQGLDKAFIDALTQSNLAYKPQFISNNHKEGKCFRLSKMNFYVVSTFVLALHLLQ